MIDEGAHRIAVVRLAESIGRHVADARERRGWTVEMLAEASGFSPRYVERIEAGGAHSINLRGLVTLAEWLGCTLRIHFEVKESEEAGHGRG
jgi:transcriptional regulator with XRE-family HTH domain